MPRRRLLIRLLHHLHRSLATLTIADIRRVIDRATKRATGSTIRNGTRRG
jgi:hypothetical protein